MSMVNSRFTGIPAEIISTTWTEFILSNTAYRKLHKYRASSCLNYKLGTFCFLFGLILTIEKFIPVPDQKTKTMVRPCTLPF